MRNNLFIISLLAAVAGMSAAAVEYPGAAPGKATAAVSGSTYTVGNDVLSADFVYATLSLLLLWLLLWCLYRHRVFLRV